MEPVMNETNEIYKLISAFLNRNETVEDKKKLINWFDQQSENTIAKSDFEPIQQNVRKRILNHIQRTEKKFNSQLLLRYTGIAAALLLIGFSVLKLWPASETLATAEQLAAVVSSKEKAIITLSSGKQIDLEKLALNESIQTGDVLIKKEANGQICYHTTKDNTITVQQNSMYTPKGSTYDLTLSDGTMVTLNADSKITYPTSFGRGDREVELQGEAYFHVSKTSNRSRFIVKSKGQQVVVLGTRFNVNAYSDTEKTQTTLEEGSVLVHLPNESKSETYLKPSEQATLLQGKLHTSKINLESVLGWKNGQFYFDGNNTEEVMQQIARWYNIEVIYRRDQRKEQYMGKIPRNLSLNKLIELLNYADLKTKALTGKDARITLIIT
jgi:Fe2+-dicitrate sensor, membrane component